jgi:hypothetical protein
MKIRKRPIFFDSAFKFNPNHKLTRDLVNLPKGVRHSSYSEISKLLGTSGCSKEEPYWGWEVLGIIETTKGLLVASPGDWIIDLVEGGKYICDQHSFENFYEACE